MYYFYIFISSVIITSYLKRLFSFLSLLLVKNLASSLMVFGLNNKKIDIDNYPEQYRIFYYFGLEFKTIKNTTEQVKSILKLKEKIMKRKLLIVDLHIFSSLEKKLTNNRFDYLTVEKKSKLVVDYVLSKNKVFSFQLLFNELFTIFTLLVIFYGIMKLKGF